MNLVYVNLSPNDDQRIYDWASQGDHNEFDPSVLGYPTTFTLRTSQGSQTILFMPVQQAFVMESLAINPNLNPKLANHQVAVSLKEIVVALKLEAQRRGIGEIYFAGSNDKTNEFATKHGMEELPWKFYRMRTVPEVEDGNIETPDVGRKAR